jgi:hypothetical protein
LSCGVVDFCSLTFAPRDVVPPRFRWTIEDVGRIGGEVPVWYWLFRAGRLNPAKSGYVVIPMWACLLAAGLPACWLWKAGRNRPPGCCSRCGYDVSATASGVCPECGAAVVWVA